MTVPKEDEKEKRRKIFLLGLEAHCRLEVGVHGPMFRGRSFRLTDLGGVGDDGTRLPT